MSLLALAVTGRGLIDPHEPAVRADDEALLRGRAAFETLKIYAGARSVSTPISTASSPRPRSWACRRSSAAGSRC